jgi:antitoxin component YwqK of YwqJK toxin-antitoxin module
MDNRPTPMPAEAHEIIRETWDNGTKKTAEYFLDGQPVGVRSWNETGQLTMERGVRDKQWHGLLHTWHENGQLEEVRWYENGKEHGTTEQYDENGDLIGTYTILYGTGIDLWFVEPRILAEERHHQEGERLGYDRWWWGKNWAIWHESHFWHGVEHGIFREWNQAGRLRRGYPRYIVAGQRVSKRQYERTCRQDPTLPPFRAEENSSTRELPEEVQRMVQVHKPDGPS